MFKTDKMNHFKFLGITYTKVLPRENRKYRTVFGSSLNEYFSILTLFKTLTLQKIG